MRAEQAKPDNGRFEVREPKEPQVEIKITFTDMAIIMQRIQELKDAIINNRK